MQTKAFLSPFHLTATEKFPFLRFDSVDIQSWWEKEALLLSQAGVELVFCPEKTVPYIAPAGFPCAGYFLDTPKQVLAVATGLGVEEWFPVFLHELCHFRQWRDNSPEWAANKMPDGREAVEVLDSWVSGEEVCEETLNMALQAALNVERDCEERTLALIKSLGLPICPVWYAKQANAYVQSYRWLRLSRVWYPAENSPYRNTKILEASPPFIVKAWDRSLRSAFESVYGV